MNGPDREDGAPRIAVIIVAWNSLPFLKTCLQAIAAAPGPAPAGPFEIFVVDNGSSDGTQDWVAAEYPRVRLIRGSENLGYPAANNIALRLILEERTAGTVLLLNSDVVADARTIEALAAYLSNRPQVGAVLPALVLPDGSFQIGACGFLPRARTLFDYFFALHKIRPVRSRGLFIDQAAVARRLPFLPVEWLSGACVALRREAFERIGLLNEEYFFYAEDLDWGRRMTEAGMALHYWPGVSVTHHHGMTYQEVLRETNIAWLRMLFHYLRTERGPFEYVLGRGFAVAGFALRTAAHSILLFPWRRPADRRKIRDVFRFFVYSFIGR
jgi:N-acetylglucosaminyl-diphospho-decaprenol L-rhamnosyltransferase